MEKPTKEQPPVVIEKDKYNKILTKLGEWSQKEGPLPHHIDAYSRLLRLQVEAKSRIAAPGLALDRELVSGRLRHGTPIVSFEDLSLDWPLVQELFRSVALVLAEYAGQHLTDALGLEGLASDVTRLKRVAEDWYQGKSLSTIAAENQVGEGLLAAAVQATLYPFLAVHSEATLNVLDQELWRRRYCPICGGKPDFAFLDKERGARWLLCSRCDTEWLFQRLECPYCGTQSHDALTYFTNKQELYRLYTCKKCQGYIKVIDLRKASAEVLLPLERIMTADLDRQAMESGYKAG
jgi:FdhE protein